jgi:hypothetical protein
MEFDFLVAASSLHLPAWMALQLTPGTVPSFGHDANERNYESARATRLQSRALSEERDRIGCFGRPELLIQIISRRPPDRPAVPRYTLAYSVSLFSNPPPSFA